MKDMGKASFLLGIEIYIDISRGGLGFSQKAYVGRALKRLNMCNCSIKEVHIVQGDNFFMSQYPKTKIEEESIKQIYCASVIGSLISA